MFGSSDDKSQPASGPAPSNNGITSFTMDPTKTDLGPAPLGTLPQDPTASPTADATSAPHLDDTSATSSEPQPSNDESSPSLPDVSLPATGDPVKNDGSVNGGSSPADDDLISIKQQALTQLTPIVQHLDQSPEDKFKTLMMMIQANDNQDLIKEAYEAAQQITDEKAKSQALLDVVNEINYFTQKDKGDK